MLQHIFPEQGWYVYTTQQITEITTIEGPFSQEAAIAHVDARRGEYFVSIYTKHHWKAPEGVTRPARWGEEV